MTIMYIVKTPHSPADMWLAPWSGDPGRTYIRQHAKVYMSEHAARCAIGRAKIYNRWKGEFTIEKLNN
jgi:hypothetical protein